MKDNLRLHSSSRSVNRCFASPVQYAAGHFLTAPAADSGDCLRKEQRILPGCKITTI